MTRNGAVAEGRMVRVVGAGLAGVLMALAAAPACGQLSARVTDTGAVSVSVRGVECLEQFQVILPAPNWQGSAVPIDCAKEEVAPGHVRVVGTLSDGRPCAGLTLECQPEADGLSLDWELAFTRDFEAETVRLNGLVPCAAAAGKGAWFVRRPDQLQWSLLPATYGEPGGNLNDWGFDWFGWLLPGDRGIRFRPLSGLTGMYLQDSRQWGDRYFQVCWTLADKGTIKAGTVLRCSIRLEALSGSDLQADSRRLGLSLLSVQPALRSQSGGGVEGAVQVRNVTPTPRPLSVVWQVRDDLGAVLGLGKQRLVAPAFGAAKALVAGRKAESGDYRLRVEVKAEPGAKAEVAEARLVVPPAGPRQAMSLDGAWELAASERGDGDTPPMEGWRSVQVPGRIDGSDANHYWYRRRFDLSPDMASKRLALRFTAVNHAARVFVNGQPVGAHFGGNLPFEIDVTAATQVGSNELWVAVTNWVAASTNPPERYEVGPFEHPGFKLEPETIIAPIGGDFRMTGIWQSVSLIAWDALHVESVFVRTSVRRHSLHVTTTLCNAGDTARTMRLSHDLADRDGPAIALPSRRVTLGAGGRREVQTEVAWAAPHLWTLDDPHLYRLTTRVVEGEREVDRTATRFGFREVWTDGPRFVLNGVPVKLFATSGGSIDTWQAARDHLVRMKRAGVRCIRMHTQPWQEHILDAADEVGMLIVDEAAVYCYQQAYATGDERFWENYAEHLRGLVRRDRNHPSLVMYSLENEILLCGGDAGRWEAQLGRMAEIVREADPTRLTTCEGDLDPAGAMDVIGMHYPREYWSGYTLYPTKCWWMDEPITYIGREWQWKRDKPLYIGEFDGGFPAWYPQYQAFWLGDEAYTFPGRFTAGSPNSRARREMIALEVEAYRQYGVTGLNPWFDADEVDLFGPTAYAPISLAVREQTRRCYAGNEIMRTVDIQNDAFCAQQLTFAWWWGGTNDRGEERLSLPPCASTSRRLRLRAPDVSTPTVATLTLNLAQNGRTLGRVEQQVRVYPRSTGTEAVAGAVRFDPSGRTAAALAAAGLRAARVADPMSLPEGTRALVIGAEALTAGEVPWAESLASFVAAGGSVLCLEQSTYPDHWLPVEVAIDPDHASPAAFIRARSHRALANVTDEDLRFWSPDAVVARRSLVKPNRGNLVPLIDAGGIRGSIDDRNGLTWVPLLELPFGRGRYLLCQLPLVERAAVEPAAAILLRDLVRYAASASPCAQSRLAVVTDPNSSLKQALDSLGATYDGPLESPAAEALRGHDLLVVGGSGTAWQTLQSRLTDTLEWVRSGGVLWLDNPAPGEAELLHEVLGMRCELRTADLAAPHLTQPDVLTEGLSNHDLYWRDRPIWDQWTALRRSSEFVPEGLPDGAVALTGPPGLVRVPYGKGCVLLSQLLWHDSPLNRLEGLRIASILLTNLGVPLDQRAWGPVDETRFRTIDLAGMCNLGFAGDPGAGWMDHGPVALAELPLGLQVLARTPFAIIDPAGNGGRSVIALRGTARPAYPAEVRGIPVGGKARALHLLHTCAWGRPDGAEALRYVVHYADGSEESIPVRVGAEIADWYVDPAPLPLAQVAWQGHTADKPGPIGLYTMRWVNPHPDKEIAGLDVVSGGGDPVPVVVAITVELEEAPSPPETR